MKFFKQYNWFAQLLGIFVLAMALFQCKEPASLSALIICDQGEETSSGLQHILENTGLFDADLNKGKSPNFAKYDVVVFHLQQESGFDEETISELANYVKSGGGALLLGTSAGILSNENDELGKAIGLAGSQQRLSNKKASYQMINANSNHPVLKGLQAKWLHNSDFMVFDTESLEGEVEILTSFQADSALGGNGKRIPALYASQMGEGKVFCSTLGANSNGDLSAVQCVGFITTLQRGAEWAATGVVSQVAPIDFPNSVSTHIWSDFKPLTMDEILEKSSIYEIGKSKKYLTDFTSRIRNSDGNSETYTSFELKIHEFLESDATTDSKIYMCRELSWIGSEKSIHILEKLVNDKDLSEAASYALQRLRM